MWRDSRVRLTVSTLTDLTKLGLSDSLLFYCYFYDLTNSYGL